MAFMNQEKKAQIRAELKKVMPKDWKWSLAVRNHSTITLTIRSAPVDIIENHIEKAREKYDPNGAFSLPEDEFEKTVEDFRKRKYMQVNHYWLDERFSGEVLSVLKKATKALNLDNYDNSDIQSDYFDVGHYVQITVGAWNKPFQVV